MATPTLDVYLTFDGNAREAMKFYADTLGGTMQAMMTFGEAPDGICDQLPPGNEDRIMHSSLMLGDRALMASDTMPGQPYQGQHGVGLALTYTTVEEAKRIFEQLAAGGEVQMPMGPTFWAESFGMCKDRFGTSWLVNGAMKPFPGA